MDLQIFADHLDQLPVFPHFALCHMIVCLLNIRIDLGTGSLYFSRKHPLICWISSIVSIFSGTILANFFLNEPVVSVFINTRQILWATAVWYLIFYSPFDITYRICNFLPIKLILYCMDEIHNCKVIYQGITHSARVFPGSYIVMIIVGIVRGNGPGFVRMIEKVMKGDWSIIDSEFMHPSYSLKVSFLVSITFITNRYCESFMISQPFILFCVVCSCVYLRISAILMDISDPFGPIEYIICMIFFGGIWDALSRAMTIDEYFRHSQMADTRTRSTKTGLLAKEGRID